MNIFIIVKISKSARFRRQFQRHDEEEGEEEVGEMSDSLRNRHSTVLAKLTNPGRNGQMTAELRSS